MVLPADSGLTQQQRNNPRLSGEFVYDSEGFELALLQHAQAYAMSVGWHKFLPSELAQQYALLNYFNALLLSIDPTVDPEKYCLHTIGDITNHKLLEAINLLEHQCDTALTQILTDAQLPPQLPPHVQLLLVAIKKLLALQTLFSRLPTQYRNYYYQEHLGFQAASPKPITAHVVAKLQSDAEPFTLPKDASFEAQTDDATESETSENLPPRQFVLKHDTVISHSQVQEVRAIYAQLDPTPTARQQSNENPKGCASLYHCDAHEECTFPVINLSPLTLSSVQSTSYAQGIYLQSQALWLAQGVRVITLSLQEALVMEGDGGVEHLKLFITTEKDWQEITADMASASRFERTANNEITITLDESFASITPLANQTEHPVLALVGVSFESAPLANISIHVSGLSDVTMRNDTQEFSGSGNFTMFGEQPSPGANFYFACLELDNKSLTSLTLHPTWVAGAVPNQSELPDIAGIYANYVDSTNAPLVVDINSYECTLVNVSATAQQLFDTTGITFEQSVTTATETLFQLQFTAGSFYYDLYVPSLNYQFQVSALENQKLIADAIISGDPVPDLVEPATVYTAYIPEISGFTLDYTAEQQNIATTALTGCESFSTPPLSLESNATNQEAFLLNITQHTVKDSLALLFLVEENNAIEFSMDDSHTQMLNTLYSAKMLSLQNGREGGESPEMTITWYILSADQQWQPLSPYLDQTQQLQTSGFIHFAWEDICEHIAEPNSDIWLKLAPCEPSSDNALSQQAFPNILGIHCQGLELTEKTPFTNVIQAGHPLPANSIQSPPTIPESSETNAIDNDAVADTVSSDSEDTGEPVSAIESIVQPEASVGGEPIELSKQFSIRVSEFIHHRARAFSQKDYERLVLEQFPSIQWVKCFSVNNASDLPQSRTIESGEIQLLIFPQAPTVDSGQTPMLPVASHHTKQEVKTFISQCCPPSIPISVESFPYTPITINIVVEFRRGIDQNTAEQQLKQATIECVMPWAYHEQSPFVKGDNWQYNVTLDISSMLSQQPSVKIIKHVEVEQQATYVSTGQNNIAILLPTSILINEEVK